MGPLQTAENKYYVTGVKTTNKWSYFTLLITSRGPPSKVLWHQPIWICRLPWKLLSLWSFKQIKNKKTKGYLDLPIMLNQFISPKSTGHGSKPGRLLRKSTCRVVFRVLASIAKVDRCLPNPRNSQWCNSDLVGFSQFGEVCWSPHLHGVVLWQVKKTVALGLIETHYVGTVVVFC